MGTKRETPPALAKKEKSEGKLSLDDRLKVWDIAIKVVGGLVLVIGTVWGYLDYRGKESDRHLAEIQYREKKDAEEQRYRVKQAEKVSQELKQREKEFRMKMYEERRPLFGEACRAAAQIVGADSLDDAKPAIKKFYELYYGELCLVETPEVMRAMIHFRHQLMKDQERMKEKNEKPSSSDELKDAAIKLAKAAQAGLNLHEIFLDVQLGNQSEKIGSKPKSDGK